MTDEELDQVQKQVAIQLDRLALANFYAEMQAKLQASSDKGKSGWQHMTMDQLYQEFHEHVHKGDAIDVALYAMMIWWHKEQAKDSKK